jgi:hypothetical protein
MTPTPYNGLPIPTSTHQLDLRKTGPPRFDLRSVERIPLQCMRSPFRAIIHFRPGSKCRGDVGDPKTNPASTSPFNQKVVNVMPARTDPISNTHLLRDLPWLYRAIVKRSTGVRFSMKLLSFVLDHPQPSGMRLAGFRQLESSGPRATQAASGRSAPLAGSIDWIGQNRYLRLSFTGKATANCCTPPWRNSPDRRPP